MHLNVSNARVRDVPSRPIYGVGERSGIKIRKVVPRISWLLLKGFFWRLREKYVIRDFHPLVFFYALGILMTLAGLVLGARRGRAALPRERDHDADDRPRRAAPDLGQPVHALRDVVRPGVEQGAALTGREPVPSVTQQLLPVETSPRSALARSGKRIASRTVCRISPSFGSG